MVDETKGGYGSGYDKRPMWQWILLYVIIGGILYYGVYYFYFRNTNSSNGSNGLYGTTSQSGGSLYGTK